MELWEFCKEMKWESSVSCSGQSGASAWDGVKHARIERRQRLAARRLCSLLVRLAPDFQMNN